MVDSRPLFILAELGNRCPLLTQLRTFRHQRANHEYQDEKGRDPEYRIVQVHPVTPQFVLSDLIVDPITLWPGRVPQVR
jgi:hypothetical protein